jgi:hypothetical protein
VPLKKYQCLLESVEAVRAFIMIGGGNPMVKARRTARAVFVLLRERDNVTGLLYQAYVGNVESYVFDSRDISGRCRGNSTGHCARWNDYMKIEIPA